MKKYFKVLVLAMFLVCCCSGYGCLLNETTTTTITNIETKRGKGENAKDRYLVFTPAGVFENTDSWFKFKFNSSDIQNTLAEAQLSRASVKLTYYWTRSNFWSWYHNIVEVTPVVPTPVVPDTPVDGKG